MRLDVISSGGGDGEWWGWGASANPGGATEPDRALVIRAIINKVTTAFKVATFRP